MARPLRLELAGGLYHITSRGDRREVIYNDDEDREKWLEIFGKVCRRFNWRSHAYCLMDNHYHVVFEIAEANLSQGMRQLNGIYTLCVANCYSSCYRELINPSAVSLTTEFIQLVGQFSHDASNFSRRITVK